MKYIKLAAVGIAMAVLTMVVAGSFPFSSEVSQTSGQWASRIADGVGSPRSTPACAVACNSVRTEVIRKEADQIFSAGAGGAILVLESIKLAGQRPANLTGFMIEVQVDGPASGAPLTGMYVGSGGCKHVSAETTKPDHRGVYVLLVSASTHACPEVWVGYGPDPTSPTPNAAVVVHLTFFLTLFMDGDPDWSLTAIA